MNKSKILKVAGLSLAGFIAVSIGVDRANIGPVAQQVAGFCGAFAGALAAQWTQHPAEAKPETPEELSVEDHPIRDHTD